MQGSVHRFDVHTGAGSVLLDDGREVPMATTALNGSGLRHVRVGQRLTLTLDDDDAPTLVLRAWMVGIGDGELIR